LAMEALEAQSKFKEKCKLSKPTISLRHEILSPAQPPKVPRTSGYLDFWLENKWILHIVKDVGTKWSFPSIHPSLHPFIYIKWRLS
jgi:hypothetical protein